MGPVRRSDFDFVLLCNASLGSGMFVFITPPLGLPAVLPPGTDGILFCRAQELLKETGLAGSSLAGAHPFSISLYAPDELGVEKPNVCFFLKER